MMTARGTTTASRTVKGTSSGARLAGIDAARGLALLAMMATHVLATFESDPQLTPTWIGLAFSGRAAALFAVLAGVGLALSTGKQQPLEGPELWAARRGIALRALVIGAVGLSLGGLEVNIAIILVHYALLFLCVLPFIGLGVKRLIALAALWILAAPVLAYLLRPWLLSADPPLRLGHNPSWEDLATPARLLGDLFLTGYYPVLQWIAYLLVGLVIGRMALSKAAVPFLLLAAGTVVAVISKWLGTVMMEDWGGRQALRGADRRSRLPAGEPAAGQPCRRRTVRLSVVAGHQCTARRHHTGSVAHLGDRCRRDRRVSPAGPAGQLAGTGSAAPAARSRGHDVEPLHGSSVHHGGPARSAAAARLDRGGCVLGAGRRGAGGWRGLRGTGVARAAGVGDPCGQPGGQLPAGPGPPASRFR